MAVIAAALDVLILLAVWKTTAAVAFVQPWPTLALVGLTYHAIGTVGMGSSAGAVLSGWFLTRVPFARCADVASG